MKLAKWSLGELSVTKKVLTTGFYITYKIKTVNIHITLLELSITQTKWKIILHFCIVINSFFIVKRYVSFL